MKNQALFTSKDKCKKLKCCLLQFLFGTLRVILSIQRLIAVGLLNMESTSGCFICNLLPVT